MMGFAVNVIVSVRQVGNALAIETPVPLQIAYRKGRWQARCESPRVESAECDSMQEAIVAGAQQAAAETQAAVIERPLIVGRITPDSIPAGMF